MSLGVKGIHSHHSFSVHYQQRMMSASHRLSYASHRDVHYVLRKGADSSIRFGFREVAGNYVLGFTSPVVASKVRDSVHPEDPPVIRLDRGDVGDCVNVAADVGGKAVPRTARVRIEKMAPSLIVKSKKDRRSKVDVPRKAVEFILDPVDTVRFFRMPFEYQVGLVIPQRLVEETATALVFDCRVVEPSHDLACFVRCWKTAIARGDVSSF